MPSFIVKINELSCTKCGACLEVCPQGVFAYASNLNGDQGNHIKVENPKECVGCLVCTESCPEDAISVKAQKK
jgi:NAD-dependent dihydropyrimidine dehydrogenase PreA subunit